MKKIAGIVWYNNEIIYRRALAIFEDAFNMPATYEDWKVGVKRIAEKYKSDGWILVRAELDPDAFPNWCKSRGLNVDTKARVTFGDEAAARYLKTGEGNFVDV